MNTNFLLGKGELLSFPVSPSGSYGDKVFPYTFEEALSRLEPQFNDISKEIDSLPKVLCPNDYAVELLTLHPAFIAKSYYPAAFLSSLGLQAIGSRNTSIKPDRWTIKRPPDKVTSTEIYIAGKRSALRSIPSRILEFEEDSAEKTDFSKIESISLANPLSPSIESVNTPDKTYFEVGIHLLPSDDESSLERAFLSYASTLDTVIYEDLSFRVGNLWFVPAFGTLENIVQLAKFVFVRVVRPMPRLRSLPSTIRTSTALRKVKLPETPAVAQDIRVAILDGGLPSQHTTQRWLNQYIESDTEAESIDDYNDHGLAVTSAFLFGPLQTAQPIVGPYAPITHIRILDGKTHSEDPLALYRTLGFIDEVLLSRQYQFINLSLGPDLPIEDHEVHAWTSVIDERLSDGQTFMTIAAGNNGDLDKESGNARIQVPADCVNAVSVGSANTLSNDWARAWYSAIGPGRCPGIVKPDLLAFGGDSTTYFHVLARGNEERIIPQLGTSFAAPLLLRTAVGIRAILGDSINALGLKAMLIHLADKDNNDIVDVGWGRIILDIEKYYLVDDGTARIIYQGELRPGKYLRAPIPLPLDQLTGNITIHATICYASEIDPEDPGVYTRSGIEVTFRPNENKKKRDAKHSISKSFFTKKEYATEEELRNDSGKWETVLNATRKFQSRTLSNPCFDIHYCARANGGKSNNTSKLSYALVVTICAPSVLDLHQQILNRYPLLTPIQPRVAIPLKV